jgi:hypothetical protein
MTAMVSKKGGSYQLESIYHCSSKKQKNFELPVLGMAYLKKDVQRGSVPLLGEEARTI